MIRKLLGLAVAFTALVGAAPAVPVKLWRFDCGNFDVKDLAQFADSFALSGKSTDMPVSCYLVKHGDTYLVWDAGLSASTPARPADPGVNMAMSLRRKLVDELADVGVKPDDVAYVAVSHHHFDHIGQASAFPKATLLIGAKDWDVVKSGQAMFGQDFSGLDPWARQGGKVEPVSGDKDVFGDGTVVMLTTPGHTWGHNSLLVRLPKTGPVILVGDLWHQSEQRRVKGVATFNVSRADTLASFDRLEQVARNLGAQIIIGHERGDIGKLPAAPAAAE